MPDDWAWMVEQIGLGTTLQVEIYEAGCHAHRDRPPAQGVAETSGSRPAEKLRQQRGKAVLA